MGYWCWNTNKQRKNLLSKDEREFLRKFEWGYTYNDRLHTTLGAGLYDFPHPRIERFRKLDALWEEARRRAGLSNMPPLREELQPSLTLRIVTTAGTIGALAFGTAAILGKL
jgi:hypothetical protein